MKKNLGGDRLGSGAKNSVGFGGYQRSTHDLSYIWRSTMSAGTLVPFMSELGLPGDKFEIGLDTDILTHPTIGPLFGSYKVQLDVFQIPIRLYQASLHMNKLGIGLDMSKIPLPQLALRGNDLDIEKNLDNQQIDPSCIFSYLNIRGMGRQNEDGNDSGKVERRFNAVPYLAYWDIFKNYYANKQEETAYVIHNELRENRAVVKNVQCRQGANDVLLFPTDSSTQNTFTGIIGGIPQNVKVIFSDNEEDFEPSRLKFKYIRAVGGGVEETLVQADELFETWTFNQGGVWIGSGFNNIYNQVDGSVYQMLSFEYSTDILLFEDIEPNLYGFPLENIDKMKEKILQAPQNGFPFVVHTPDPIEPYTLPMHTVTQQQQGQDEETFFSMMSSQEGLAVKTYQSDLFNNWIQTEWLDGETGINQITKVNIEGTGTDNAGFFIDQLNLKYKIHKMLMRIGVSGGTYDDWQEAVYDHKGNRKAESPMYEGGLIKELAFQSVISNAETEGQPLGTLGGRGQLTGKHKGGKVDVKVHEPSYVMGIISLTPRVDYSQGNKWDVNLKTMDDLHKPSLDAIGFQELITDQMAFWDTQSPNAETVGDPEFKSAGKQPAWLNYMTNVNQVRGNFAKENDMMFMTLNRRYEPNTDELEAGTEGIKIKDLTTYIDPAKFNHIFAYTRRDAQNFWTQIKVDIKARRVMSAKVMPNL